MKERFISFIIEYRLFFVSVVWILFLVVLFCYLFFLLSPIGAMYIVLFSLIVFIAKKISSK